MSHSRKTSSCSDHQELNKIQHHPQSHSDLQSILSKQLGPEYLSTRPGAGGSKLTYIEGWRIIALANEVFGYDGWSSETKTIEVDFVDSTPDGRFNVGVSAIVKITLKNGTSREDVGYGKLENSRSKADALDKCKKEAVTDALKRTMRTFGNLLGNCLYDKSYLSNIKTMQAQKEKFLPSKLYRPEHVNNSSTSEKIAVSKPCHAQSSTGEQEVPKPKLTTAGSNNLTTTKLSVTSISKPQINQITHQSAHLERKIDPTELPPPRVPEKRKFQEEDEVNNNNPIEQAEHQKTMDDSIPFPATLSDNYFDLDESELAELDNVESSEIFGVQSGQGCSGDESGLITDASIQLDDQSTTFGPPLMKHHQQDPTTKRSKTLYPVASRPLAAKSTTNNSNSIARLNSVPSVPHPPQKVPLKTGNNLLDKSSRPHAHKVNTAGQLPNIKSSVIRYPTNTNRPLFNNYVPLGK